MHFDETMYENNDYKSKLYALLKLFDQKSRVKNNEHRLRLFQRMFPEFLERVIKRIQAAAVEYPDLEKQMSAEDFYLKVLKERDNKISFFKLKIREKDKALTEKDKVIYDLAKTMKENNIPVEIIVQKTQLSKDIIAKL